MRFQNDLREIGYSLSACVKSTQSLSVVCVVLIPLVWRNYTTTQSQFVIILIDYLNNCLDV